MTSAAREHMLKGWARALGTAIAAFGIFVLMGWAFDIATIKSVAPLLPTMKANAATCFVLCGVLLALCVSPASERTYAEGFAARVIAALVVLIATITLAEYAFGIDAGIDQLLFADVDSALTFSPGRMAPATAVAFLLTVAAILSLDLDTRQRPAQWLATVLFAIGYLTLMGFVYNVQALYRVSIFTAMALHTAALFMLLAIGILAARPSQGFMRIVVSDGAGGVSIRRLLPVALLLPPLIDWLQVRSTDPQSIGFNLIFMAMINVAILLGIAWWTANSIRIADLARHEAEAGRQTGEERLHVAVQSSGGGAWDWDLSGDVTWWSPEMYALWGVAPDTVIRLNMVMDFIHAEDRDQVRRSVETAIATGTAFNCEYRMQSNDGAERWMSSRGRVTYDDRGKPWRMVGITLDIGAQKRTERELRLLNEALERSNIELSRFAYVASHDLQTPMRSVASFAELVKSRYADKLDAQGLDWLQRIVQSAHQLQALVKDLLHYSRVESQTWPFAPVAMEQVWDGAVALLDPAIRETGAAVTRDALPVIVGDATQLRELLLNLISNALKYRGDAAPRVHFSAERDGEMWRFAVRDNGIGIDPRHRDRIFDVFERLHTQQQYPGTGIGLAICRRVVERHGGKLWVESEPNVGSTFLFTLAARERE